MFQQQSLYSNSDINQVISKYYNPTKSNLTSKSQYFPSQNTKTPSNVSQLQGAIFDKKFDSNKQNIMKILYNQPVRDTLQIIKQTNKIDELINTYDDETSEFQSKNPNAPELGNNSYIKLGNFPNLKSKNTKNLNANSNFNDLYLQQQGSLIINQPDMLQQKDKSDDELPIVLRKKFTQNILIQDEPRPSLSSNHPSNSKDIGTTAGNTIAGQSNLITKNTLSNSNSNLNYNFSSSNINSNLVSSLNHNISIIPNNNNNNLLTTFNDDILSRSCYQPLNKANNEILSKAKNEFQINQTNNLLSNKIVGSHNISTLPESKSLGSIKFNGLTAADQLLLDKYQPSSLENKPLKIIPDTRPSFSQCQGFQSNSVSNFSAKFFGDHSSSTQQVSNTTKITSDAIAASKTNDTNYSNYSQDNTASLTKANNCYNSNKNFVVTSTSFNNSNNNNNNNNANAEKNVLTTSSLQNFSLNIQSQQSPKSQNVTYSQINQHKDISGSQFTKTFSFQKNNIEANKQIQISHFSSNCLQNPLTTSDTTSKFLPTSIKFQVQQPLQTPVVFPEGSTTQQKLEILYQGCQHGNLFFIDYDFPPQNQAAGVQNQEIQWKRPLSFNGIKYLIFREKVNPTDVTFNDIGESYFQACLSLLAENQGTIDQLFVTKQLTDIGYFIVKICNNGAFQDIIIDDHFPQLQNRPAFCSSVKHNELWVQILEKSWAKLCNGYSKIQKGQISEVLHDLTGAPVNRVTMSEEVRYSYTDRIWKKLVESEQKMYLVSCVLKGKQSQQQVQTLLGFPRCSFFTFLKTLEFSINDLDYKLVQLRYTSIQKDWDRIVSSESRTKNYLNEDVCEYLKFNGMNKQDGIFYLYYSDFLRLINELNICHYQPNFRYTSKQFSFEGNNQIKLFKLQVKFEGSYKLQVSQPSNYSDTNFGSDYLKFDQCYSHIQLVVTSADSEFKPIICVKGNARDLTSLKQLNNSENLHVGEYYAYISVEFNTEKNKKYGFGVYGPDSVEIQDDAFIFDSNNIKNTIQSKISSKLLEFEEYY